MTPRTKTTVAGTSTSLFWIILFVVAALSVFAFKIYLAYATQGAPDISAWKDFLRNIQNCGVCVYETGGLMYEPKGGRYTPFNHPPFVIHYLRLINALSNLFNVDFAFAFRAVTSIFDLGSALLLYKLLQRYGLFNPVAFLLYLLAPATIIISGFHGQTDTLMIFFVLLAVFLIEKPVFSGLAFGCALSIKIVPVIWALAFILYLLRRQRLQFIAAATAIGFILALPYILLDPAAIVREVLGYGSFPGRWGWTRALYGVMGPSPLFWIVARIGAYLLLVYVWYLSWKVNRSRLPLLTQLGLIVFVVLAFTPSWGTNYMAWLDPFPVPLGVWPALAYYATSGLLLGYLYVIEDDESSRLIGIAWLGVLFVTLAYLRYVRHRTSAVPEVNAPPVQEQG